MKSEVERRRDRERREAQRFLQKASPRVRFQEKFKKAVGRKQFQKVRG